jgi:hypothetical protein
MSLTEIIIENIGVFAAAGGGVLGAVLAALWVVRYRLPSLEERTNDHDTRISELESDRTKGCFSLVKKSELYREDGQPVYVHVDSCKQARSECGKDGDEDILAIRNDLHLLKNRLEQMERARANARSLQLQFMSAVKEKLDLKFTVPVD